MDAKVILDLYWISLLVGTVLPVAVALISARVAPGSVKTWVLLALALGTAVGQELIDREGAFVVKDFVSYLIVTLFTAISMHFGVLQPLRITGRDGVVQTALPGGVGGASAH